MVLQVKKSTMKFVQNKKNCVALKTEDEMEETLAHMPPEVIDNTLIDFGVQLKASWNRGF